ncbi:MAG: GFA family protein [Pseudomonadota bacterium]
MIVHGSCHCGSITFEAEIDPEDVFICHCTDCRALSGTAFRTIVLCRHHNFFPLTGTPRFYIKKADSGARRALAFCGDCGSPIHSTDADDRMADYAIRTGVLSEAAELVPKRQIWSASALPWLYRINDLPSDDAE